MAIKLAGIRTEKTSDLKIENQSSIDLPKGTEENIRKIFAHLPSEHQRGLERIRLVDFINNAQLKNSPVPIKGDLPGLYHPKMQNKNAWLEIAIGALLQPTENFGKRWMAKMRNIFGGCRNLEIVQIRADENITRICVSYNHLTLPATACVDG